jgi:predicted transcriptional regulator
MRKGIKPRSRWEIIYTILKETSREEERTGGKAKKTRIMHGAYLDWRNFQRHLDFLIEQGFINYTEEEGHCHLTERGRNLLEQLEEVKDMIERPPTTSKTLFRFQF